MQASIAILEMLRQYDVTDVFGLPGETTLGLYRVWEAFPDVRYHLCRDERSSVYMADAYAKSSGKAGICEGPSSGVAHMAPGLIEALQSCVPVICFTSDIQLGYGMKNMLTAYDQTAFFKSVTKDTYMVNKPEELPHLIRRAFRTATAGTPGPVHIRIPSDIFDGEVPNGEVYAQPRFGKFPGCRGAAAREDIEAVAEKLLAAKRPVMICGHGVVHSGAWREVMELAEQQQMLVGSTINAKGAIPERHPLSLGVIGARGGHKWNNDMVRDADLVLFAGTSTDSANTDGWQVPRSGSNQTFIQIDIEERELGNNYDALPLFGDARETLRELIRILPQKKQEERITWTERAAKEREAHEKTLQKFIAAQGDRLHPLSLIRAIEALATEDAFFAVDPGISALYSAGYLRLEKAGRRAAYNFSMGALGYAIPAAIGARFGVPAGTAVVGLVGDGSFGFCAGELETAARLGAKIVYVIFNNQTFGWIRGTEFVHEKAALSPGFDQFTNFAKIDYVKFAESFGIKGYRADGLADFKNIFKQCLAEEGPCLIDVPVLPQDKQLPPVPDWAKSGLTAPEDMLY